MNKALTLQGTEVGKTDLIKMMPDDQIVVLRWH